MNKKGHNRLLTGLLLIALLTLSATITAQESATQKKATKVHDTSALLKELDKVVANKNIYRDAALHSIDSMKQVAAGAKGEKLVKLYENIVKGYSHLKADSAMVYIKKMRALPEVNTNKAWLERLHTAHAEVLAVMGQYDAAETELRKVTLKWASKQDSLFYYEVRRTMYGWMEHYTEVMEVREMLTEATDLYRDSILMLESAGINHDIVVADKLCTEGDAMGAIKLCMRQQEKADILQQAYLNFTMAEAYRMLGKKEERLYHLAKTAICDLQRGVTEYQALQQLAQMLYEDKDNERAYTYLICAMEDANYCKARLRSMEASSIFPIIDKAYKTKVKEQQQLGHVFTIILATLALILIGVSLYLHVQMGKLRVTRQKLTMANDELKSTNHELQISDKVKEEYIARYLDRCRGYLDNFDKLRKQLLKMAKARKYNEILQYMEDEDVTDKEQDKFYADFDEAFIHLFPHFIDNFNALLQEEARITPKPNELLSTELRIFALIRLGVTDSNRIAHFLNYSVATIYSYRSRLRNKSLYEKNVFEQKVMEC